jgi:hypothetical protein
MKIIGIPSSSFKTFSTIYPFFSDDVRIEDRKVTGDASESALLKMSGQI